MTGISSNQFAVRWTGYVLAQIAGSYYFQTQGDDGIRLWVNETKILENWDTHDTETDTSVAVTLTAQALVPVVLEFFEGAGDADILLQWKKPGDGSFSTIPSTNLFAPQLGETIALANLPEAAKDGVLVPHYSRKDRQWNLFFIGGGTGSGVPLDNNIASYSFSANTWTQIDLDDTDISQRTGVAACSWGDEVFIFSGARAGTPKRNAIAYNPDNEKYRTLANFTGTSAVVYQAAVPVGPYIYLLGGATDDTGTGNGTSYLFRYTP